MYVYGNSAVSCCSVLRTTCPWGQQRIYFCGPYTPLSGIRWDGSPTPSLIGAKWIEFLENAITRRKTYFVRCPGAGCLVNDPSAGCCLWVLSEGYDGESRGKEPQARPCASCHQLGAEHQHLPSCRATPMYGPSVDHRGSCHLPQRRSRTSPHGLNSSLGTAVPRAGAPMTGTPTAAVSCWHSHCAWGSLLYMRSCV